MSNKEYNLQVRLSVAEKKTLSEAARVAGTSTSAWVRDRLRRVAREELQSVGISVPFLDDLRSKSSS